MAPEPMTSMLAGALGKVRACLLPMMRLPSMGKAGISRVRAPVAIRIFEACSRETEPSGAVTSTSPGFGMEAVPCRRSMPCFLKRNSMPLHRRFPISGHILHFHAVCLRSL